MRRQHRDPRHGRGRHDRTAGHRELEASSSATRRRSRRLRRRPACDRARLGPATRRVRRGRRPAETALVGEQQAVELVGADGSDLEGHPTVLAGRIGAALADFASHRPRAHAPTYVNPANSSTSATRKMPPRPPPGNTTARTAPRDPHELEPGFEARERPPADRVGTVALEQAVERHPSARGGRRNRERGRDERRPPVRARGVDERAPRERAACRRGSIPRAPSCAATAR